MPRAPASSPYVAVELGGSTPHQINRAGQIAVTYHPSGSERAFLWDNWTKTDLGTLGGRFTKPFALNNAGQVVGIADTTSGATHAFLWENGVMIDLGTLGGDTSLPHDINSMGQVVGRSEIASGQWRAFLWENGVMTNLGALWEGRGVEGWRPLSVAFAINDAGQVVGGSRLRLRRGPQVIHAFLWERGAIS